jgi:succinate-semialdehyde dehydrogenase/glutarate-semialdehyde dehydrogenase
MGQAAVDRGAKVLVGGKRPEGEEYAKGNFYLPTVLVDVPTDARMVQEECFGPALPVFRVKDLDDAITQANNSKYGLGSSIWTTNLAKAQQAAERIEAAPGGADDDEVAAH